MKTSSAKAKGRHCAREVKDKLLEWAPNLEERDFVITSSGETGPDLKLSPRASETYPFVVECKNVEKFNVWKALEQNEKHEGEGYPILFFKRNNSKLYACMEIDNFLKLVR